MEPGTGGVEGLAMTRSTTAPNGMPCHSCGSTRQTQILSLGRLPLANAYPLIEDTAEEPRFPLDLAFCEACSLVQLEHVVPRDQLFSDYLYFSSYSGSMLRHSEALVGQLVTERGLGSDSLAVEIASNDGYLLQFFQKAGVPVLGIEPATNIARVAEERGIPTINAFFGEQLGAELREQHGQGADVILGLNVMAHVDDLNGFVRGIGALLKEEGVAVVEAPYVRDMVEHVEFDTIYHEHLCYFSVHAVARLVERHGLVLERVDRIPIHGGSLRLFISHGDAHGPTTERLLNEEKALGLNRDSYYGDFRRRVEEIRDSLNELVAELRAKGDTIAGYGAAAKATVLLNYCGLNQDHIAFVADRNPHKQGRRMPGCGIPVYSPDAITERRPDYVLLFVWNLRDEILRQEQSYRQSGGRFIVPVPKVEVV